MSQRNPMNERYNDENRKGKTRKSAASAKPSAERAATVYTPGPKTKKQKKAEARERERKQEEKQRQQAVTPDGKTFEQQPEYKKLRRWWWACLIGAIILIVLSFLSSREGALNSLYIYFLIGGYVLVIAAFYIDLGKIRKLRKQYEQKVMKGKSKEARAQQKAARAEARAQQKEAEEKFEAAKAAEEEKKANSPLNRFKGKFLAPKEPASDSSSEDGQSSS